MRYVPGEWCTVVTPQVSAMLPADTSVSTVERIWSACSGDSSFADVLQVIISELGPSLTRMPAFGLVGLDGRTAHIAVRAGIKAVVQSDGVLTQIDGVGVSTWREQGINDVSTLVLVGDPTDPDGETWPVVSGVVGAARLDQVGSLASATRAATAVEDESVDEESSEKGESEAMALASASIESSGEVSGDEVGATVEEADVVVEEGPSAAGAGAAQPVETADVTPDPGSSAQSPSTPVVPTSPSPVASSGQSAPPPEPERHPTGETTLMPGEEAADDDLHSTTFFSHLWEDPNAPASPSWSGDAAAQISGVPGAAPGAGASGGVAQSSWPDEPDDHDGETVMALDLESAEDEDHDGETVLALDLESAESEDHDGETVLGLSDLAPTPGTSPVAPPPPPPPPDTPVVLARVCARCGTPNSTRRTTCRSCGAPLTGDAVQVGRPPLGLVRLPSGEQVSLEHPIIIGRRPAVERFSHSDMPVVVRINDPHVSSTHLKIDLEDWSVLVTSLGRNGSLLRRLGQPDRMLGHGEQVLAEAGDVYSLGEGIDVAVVRLT